MDIEIYLTTFDAIRVGLDRQQLLKLDPAITTVDTTLSEISDRLWTPWYTSKTGGIRKYRHADAVPVSLAVASGSSLLRRYHGVSHQFNGPVPVLCLPVYALPDGHYLLLDGTHRAVAALLDGRPFQVRLCVIQGPLDPSVLPDLQHWLPASASHNNHRMLRSGLERLVGRFRFAW